MRLHGMAWAGLLAGAALAAPAGCGGYEERCDLNPYVCPESGGGGSSTSWHGPSCGPCEVDDRLGGCEPVKLPSSGDCPSKDLCSPDLSCKRTIGRSCMQGTECATGVCSPATKECALCATDADCTAQPEAPLCLAGWCRRPSGAACESSFACITNRCFAGVCAGCATGVDCAGGQCDDDTHHCLTPPGEPCVSPAECSSGQCEGGVCTP